MPTYDYFCSKCDKTFEEVHPIAELDFEHPCPDCQNPAERRLSSPRVLGDYQGYSCPVTGKWIEGKKAHRENLARTGCRILEPGEEKEAARRRREMDSKLEARIEETALRKLQELPQEKFEILAGELTHGAGSDPASDTFVRQTVSG